MQLTVGGNTKRSKLGTFAIELPDFNDLPEATRNFIVAYGLKQYLADGMAGAADRDDAQAGIDERKRKLIEADFQRTRGEGTAKPDSLEARTLKLVKAAIREAMKAKSVKATKEMVDAAAQKLLESEGADKFRKEAQRQLDTEAKFKGEADVMDDILADLIGDDSED